MSLFIAFLCSFLLSYLLTPVAIRVAKKFSLIDSPNKRLKTAQIHKGAIPRAGGLSIGLAIIISILVILPITKVSSGILIAVVLTIIVGIYDDVNESSPYTRFILNILISGIVVAAGIGIPYVTNPFNGVFHLDNIRWSFSLMGSDFSILPLADIAALIWIVWAMNIIGWSGGIDGQMPGFVTIAAVIIGILSFRFSAHDISQNQVAALAFITAGGFAGFLPWNFYPQKIMPGYSGKSLAGLLLATLSILSGAKLGTALLVLSIPITDAIFTMLRRIAERKSPFWGDRGHLHHKLLERGWGKRRIAVFYWITTASFGLIALNLTSTFDKFFAAGVVVITILMALTWLHYFAKKV